MPPHTCSFTQLRKKTFSSSTLKCISFLQPSHSDPGDRLPDDLYRTPSAVGRVPRRGRPVKAKAVAGDTTKSGGSAKVQPAETVDICASEPLAAVSCVSRNDVERN